MTISEPSTDYSQDLARVFRAESGRVLAALLAYSRDFELTEDALQEACLQAMEQWPQKGVPQNKGAWLLTVAKRRLIDKIRRCSFQNKQQTLQSIIDTQPEQVEDELNFPIPDERLKLIFTCCHPALAEQAQVALTLKTVSGLKVSEIARAFLTSEVTMNQRITRAKRKIKTAGIPYKIPAVKVLPERISSVLSVIYLIFNESYLAYEGQTLTRFELANEAIRLARILNDLLPRADVKGLLALMLFHHSRYFARSNKKQAFVPLEKQDRVSWDQSLISQGNKFLTEAMNIGEPESYQIQAAISALHAQADSWENTDWQQILLLYQSLYRRNPNAIICLNLNVALAHSGELKKAYKVIVRLEKELTNYQPYYAARAYIKAKSGKKLAAKNDYEKAISLTKNSIERDYLISQRDELNKGFRNGKIFLNLRGVTSES